MKKVVSLVALLLLMPSAFAALVKVPVTEDIGLNFTRNETLFLSLKHQPVSFSVTINTTGSGNIQYYADGLRVFTGGSGRFENICVDTCEGFNATQNVTLQVVVNEGSTFLEKVVYETLQEFDLSPKWVYPATEFRINDTINIDLLKAFEDPEGKPLSFAAETGTNLQVSILGGVLQVTPAEGFLGKDTVTVTASDGNGEVAQVLSIEVVKPMVVLKAEIGEKVAPKQGEILLSNDSRIAANKTKDDPFFDTIFTFTGKVGNNFVVKFYHNSSIAQPVRVDGITDYSLSKDTVAPLEEVTLSVPFQGAKVPKFKLTVGKASEEFNFGITIINIKSYPNLGGQWVVYFNTTGTADLTVSGFNGTHFDQDLNFVEIKCGDTVMNATKGANNYTVRDYYCADGVNGTEISTVATTGPHTLEFRFGDSVGYAYNQASCTVFLGSALITAVTACTTTGGRNLNLTANVVTTDATAGCVNITGVNARRIDCWGKSIEGPTGAGIGIKLVGNVAQTNVSITTCNIYNFTTGIEFQSGSAGEVDGGAIVNTTIANVTGSGISITGSTNNYCMQANTFLNNTIGLNMTITQQDNANISLLLADSKFINNSMAGIVLTSGNTGVGVGKTSAQAFINLSNLTFAGNGVDINITSANGSIGGMMNVTFKNMSVPRLIATNYSLPAKSSTSALTPGKNALRDQHQNFGASIDFMKKIDITSTPRKVNDAVILGENFSRVVTTTATEFNQTARVTFLGEIFRAQTASTLRDENRTGTYIGCAASECINASWNDDDYSFTVLDWSDYAMSGSKRPLCRPNDPNDQNGVTAVVACQTITTAGNYTLAGVLNGVQTVPITTSYCIGIGTSNVFFECTGGGRVNGTRLSGTNPTQGFLITSTTANLSNISIKNCRADNYSIGLAIGGSPTLNFTEIFIENFTMGSNINQTFILHIKDSCIDGGFSTPVLAGQSLDGNAQDAFSMASTERVIIANRTEILPQDTFKITQSPVPGISVPGAIITNNIDFYNITIVGKTMGFNITQSENISFRNLNISNTSIAGILLDSVPGTVNYISVENASINTTPGGVTVHIRDGGWNVTFNSTATNNSVTIENTTLGVINYTQAMNFSNWTVILGYVNISKNFTFVDSVNNPLLNRSAKLTFKLYPNAVKAATAAWNDSSQGGVLNACPSGVCANFSTTGFDTMFDVARFSAFAVQGRPTAVCSGRTAPAIDDTINVCLNYENLTLRNLSFPSSAYDQNCVNVTNVTHGVIVCGTVTGPNTGYFLRIANSSNITVQNCSIRNYTSSIIIYNSNVTFINATVQGENLTNGTVVTNSLGTCIDSTSFGNVSRALILENSTGTVLGNTSSSNNTIAAFAINASPFLFAYNTSISNASVGFNITTSNYIEIFNTTSLFQTNDIGIRALNSFNANFTGNVLTGHNTSIFVQNEFNVTLRDTVMDNNFIVENTSRGYINWTNATINFSTRRTLIDIINISLNFTRTNVVTAPELNTTAWLKFTGLSAFTDPQPIRDPEDDGTWVTCGSLCTEISFSGGTYIYNVTSWTTYAGNETPAAGGAAPSAPTLLLPPNSSTTNNRTPIFFWANASHSTTGAVTYQIEVSVTETFTDAILNVSGINETSVNTTFVMPSILNFTRYWWHVRANDSNGYGSYSSTFNFTVQRLNGIIMLANVIQFFTHLPLDINTTEDNVPNPFVVENDGNFNQNVTVSGTKLFTSATNTFPGPNFTYMVAVNETNSFNNSASVSTLSYVAVNNTGDAVRVDVRDLEWRDSNDSARIHVNITVPADEPVTSLLLSNFTFNASSG